MYEIINVRVRFDRAWLKKAIAKSPLKMEEIAEQAGIHRATFSHIYRGSRGTTKRTADKIIEAINNSYLGKKESK